MQEMKVSAAQAMGYAEASCFLVVSWFWRSVCGLSVSYWELSADKYGGKYSQISLFLNIEAPDFLGYHCSNLTALQISLKRLGTYGNSPTFLITFFFSKDIKRSMLLYSKMLKIHRFLFDATNEGIILVKESPRNGSSSQHYSANHFSFLPHNPSLCY